MSLLGEALLDAARGVFLELAAHRDDAVEWIREVARAPPGVELRAPDGAIYTGVAVVDRGHVILLVAFRHDGPMHTEPPYRPVVTPPPLPRNPRQFLDDFEWDRDGDPFQRR